jgi:hypothetical protein
MSAADRITSSQDLGRAHRSFDLFLGTAALVPVAGAAVDVWLFRPGAGVVAALASLWSGALLVFFAGVRRGLTFSEAGGGRPLELASMLWLFAIGMAAILLQSALLGAVGFASVGVLDALSARKAEAPAYFKVFRPVQMTLAAAALLAIFVRMLAER